MPTPTSSQFPVDIKKVRKYVLFGIAALFAVITFFGSYGTVPPGHRGIRVTLGKTGEDVLGEGPHFKLPFVSEIRLMDIRVHMTQDATDAATHDIQQVTAKFAINWTIDPASVGKMLREVGDEVSIENNIIMPAVPEALKAATAKMTAEEVLTRRTELKQMIDEALIKRLSSYGLVIKDISLVDLNFTHKFNQSVEDKQIAQQQAQQAEYEAQKAKIDATSRVNAARGQAEANLTIAKAQAESNLAIAKTEAEANLIKAKAQAESQKLLQQTLTASVLRLEYLKKWDGQLPNVLTGNGNGVMLNLPVNTKSGAAATATEETSEGDQQ